MEILEEGQQQEAIQIIEVLTILLVIYQHKVKGVILEKLLDTCLLADVLVDKDAVLDQELLDINENNKNNQKLKCY